MPQTLHNFLTDHNINPDLASLISQVLAPAVVQIRAAIESSYGGYAGTSNASGEAQLKLDMKANEIMVEALKKSPLIHSLASEELEDIVMVNEKGAYSLAFDPLDGSSLVDANLAIGTIFGIYPKGDFVGQKGRDQLASGIVVYGPKTSLFLAIPGIGVHYFELSAHGYCPSCEKFVTRSSSSKVPMPDFSDCSMDFILQKGPITIDVDSKYFAPGNARAAVDHPIYLEVINDWIKRGLTLRYSGGMVPDIAHILAKGSGVFAYPGYPKAPMGKLRLLFECNPISLIIEEAGGESSDGKQPILDKEISAIHERSPIFCGSKNEVNKIVEKLSPM